MSGAFDWTRFKVEHLVPDTGSGIWRTRHFDIPEGSTDPEYTRAVSQDRDPGTGRFVCLEYLDDTGDTYVWRPMMTDTKAEILDHRPAIDRITDPSTHRVLVHGLGLGVIVRAALMQPHVEHVDVVDLSPDVIAVVGPIHADPRLTIHWGNALTHRFPPGDRWDVVWHDIWPTISAVNLPDMRTLHRRYGHRCTWQGSWARVQCLRDRANRQRVTRILGRATGDAHLTMCRAVEGDIEAFMAGLATDVQATLGVTLPPGFFDDQVEGVA